MFNSKIMIRSKLARTFLLAILISIGFGVFLFINQVDVADAQTSFSVAPAVSGIDDVAGATGTLWRVSVTTSMSAVWSSGDIFRITLPTTTAGSPFLISNPTSTVMSGITLYKSLLGAPPYPLGVSSTVITSSGRPAFYGLLNNNLAIGTAFSMTLGYVTNPSVAGNNFEWKMEKWAFPPLPTGVPSMDAAGPPAPIVVTTTAAITSPPTPPLQLITNLTLVDSDTTSYGLDGRDFTVTWTPSSTWNPSANGYQSTRVYIVPVGTTLTTSNVETTGCGGGPCLPVGFFNQYQMATATIPQFMQTDSASQNWTTTTQYVAWVNVVAQSSSIASSSPSTITFDTVSDTNPPQIDHMPVHTALAGSAVTLYAFLFDDQTTEAQFASTTDGGAERFSIYFYHVGVLSWASTGAAVPVSSVSNLYSLTFNSAFVPAAGNTLRYFLFSQDRNGNDRFVCADPNANSSAACQASPFVINIVASGSRSVSGQITSAGGSGLSGAKVFAGGWGGSIVTTDGSGNYTISGLPNNDAFDFTAAKTGYVKSTRMETIGTTDKTGINLSLNMGDFGFYQGSGGGGNTGGGAPSVMFSGPPDGMQGVQTGEKIRVGFNQSMNALTINSVNTTTSIDNVYLMNTVTGSKVPGTVTYCANNASPGCSDLFSMDQNTILFSPTAALATSTPYTLVITESVKSDSGQQVQGNRTGGGHKINFTTIGNSFSYSTSEWGAQFQQGGQFLPPFVKSMSPAPGMSVPSNTKILLEFNQAMNSNTINTTNITLWSGGTQISSGVSITLDSNEKRFATISHNALSAGEYEVRVSGGATAASGAPMRSNSSETAFSSRFNSSGSTDTTAPTVYALASNNSTGVSTDSIFEFGLSEQLTVDSVSNSNVTMSRGSTGVSMVVSYDPGKNSIFVVPNDVLAPNTVYTIVLGSGLTDLAGRALVTSTYTYTTGGVDTTAPAIKEARCDDYKCYISFTKSMNHDIQSDTNWASSTLNHVNLSLTQGGADKIVTSTIINYDAADRSIIVDGVGLTVGSGNFTLIVSGVTDASDILLSSATVVGNVEDSKQTFGSFDDTGMFGPPTGDFMSGGGIGGGEFKPQGFGNFTAEQFSFGDADMAFAMNPIVSQDANVFQVRFKPDVALANGDKIAITFPAGTNVSSTVFDTRSPFYSDFNQFDPGTVTGTAITVDNTARKVTVTLGITGTPTANDAYTVDLSKIINPSIPKGPSTGGYTVTLQAIRGSTVLANKTSMPYFIESGGSSSITLGVYANSSTAPTAGANGTVYLHGGGPSGPMDKVLTLTNGAISAVDGVATTTLVYPGLRDGCYFVGTEPSVTLSGVDYFGQMSPEPICVNSESRSKNIILTSAGGTNSASVTVKLVDANGNPYTFSPAKNVDIFAGGPGKFVVKTLSDVTATEAAGYTLRLPTNGHWNIGVGPAMSKGPSSGKPTSLGVMSPPPIDLVVSGVGGSTTVSAGMFTPPGVSFNDTTDTITITFASAGANKTVTGTVKDVAGNGLSNINVMMNRQGFGAPEFTQTNASGTFSLSVPVGNYEIGVTKDGMPPVFKSIDVRSNGNYVNGNLITGGNPLVLVMKKSAYSISGKVLDSNSNGISGAPLFARDANGISVFGMSGNDGSYTLFVDNGAWTINVQMPPDQSDTCGSFSKTVTVAGSSQSSQNITPSSGTCVTLSGTVTAGGATLNNVPLFVEEWNTTNSAPVADGLKRPASTASDGTYSVKVLPSKTYRIGTWHPDYGELSATKAVAESSTTQDITVAADTVTFSFTGGQSTMNAMIEMKNSADKNKVIRKQVSGLATTTAINIQNAATYNYFVDVFGYGKFSGTVTSTGAADAVTIDVSTDYVTVTGTIKDASNNVLPGASVNLINTSTNMVASDLTDSSGMYEMKVKAGNYQMSSNISGYVSPIPASVSFTTNTTGYDFASGQDQTPLIDSDFVIEGVVSSTASAVMTEGYVWATNASGTVVSAPIEANGHYSLPVTNGVWSVKATGPLKAETAGVTTTISGADDTSGNNFILTADATRVPTSTSGILSADVGGSINDSNASGMKLTVGQGVLETGSGDVTLNVEKSYNAPDSGTYQALANTTFGIEANGTTAIKKLNGNVEIQIDYSSLLTSLPSSTLESNLQLMYYSPERADYVPVEGGYTVDTANNTITGLVNHFTDFVLAYVPAASSGDSSPQQSQTPVSGGGAAAVSPPTLPVASPVVAQAVVSNTYELNKATAVTVGVSAHTVTVSVASESEAVVKIESEPITVTLKKDEAQELDTNKDTIADLRVTYLGLVETKPKLSFVNLVDAGELKNAVTINAGAYETNTTTVTLKLNATNAIQMKLSNVSDFAGAAYIVYATNTKWILTSGNAVKTVYVKFKSNDGGEVSTSDTIKLVGQSVEEVKEVKAETAYKYYRFTKELRSGSKGDEVKELQTLLVKLGYLDAAKQTGVFDKVTKLAIKSFQKANKQKKTGYVGPATRAKLNKLGKKLSKGIIVKTTTIVKTAITPVVKSTSVSTPKTKTTPAIMLTKNLSLGSRSLEVTRLQQILRKLGYFTYPENTDYFGLVTKSALIKFQQNFELPPTGILESLTRSALNGFE